MLCNIQIMYIYMCTHTVCECVYIYIYCVEFVIKWSLMGRKSSICMGSEV